MTTLDGRVLAERDVKEKGFFSVTTSTGVLDFAFQVQEKEKAVGMKVYIHIHVPRH